MATPEQLVDAVKRGDLQEVTRLVEADTSLASATDADGVSAVSLAAYHGRLDIAQLLVERGAFVSAFDAAALGRTDCLAALLRDEPSVATAYSPDGFTALGLAAFFGHVDAVSLLLTRGAEPNAVSRNAMRVAPLHSAVAHRQEAASLAMARALVDAGADVHGKQAGGWTPLHAAAAHGRRELVEFLLARGADPAARTEDGRTAETMARQAGFDDVAEELRGALA